MNATTTNLLSLPPLQRRMADAWLARFEDGWNPQKLPEFLRSLPPKSSLRQPLLQEMVQRDLDHHWQQGQEKTVEEYLHSYPELGSVDDIPIDLIASEYHARDRMGKAELSEFAERFPSRIDDLYVLLKPDLFDAAPPANQSKLNGSLDERRKQLLQAPPTGEAADPLAERRKMLLRTPSNDDVSLPAQPDDELSSSSTETPPRTEVVSELDFVLPPSAMLSGPPVADAAHHSETQWVDIETIRQAPKKSSPAMPEPPAPARSAQAPLPLAEFGHYRIINRVGSRGSCLFEATDMQSNRRVALKIPQLAGDVSDEARARFQREGRAAAAVYHPLLCPVLEFGQIDGIDYFAMPLVDGEPLNRVLQQRSIWPPRTAVMFVTKLAMALEIAHRQRLIHRDLRPANIVITPTETPVIVGFASAVARDDTVDPADAVYLAPEHAQGEERMGPQADVFSLGVLLFQLLTGKTPPPGLPESAFPSDLPPDLKNFCRKALDVRPEDRPSGMEEVARTLNGFLGRLRPSDLEVRGAALSGSFQGRILAGAGAALPPRNASPPPENPAANAMSSQMQELRQLSNWSVPPPSQRAPIKWQIPWVWCVSFGFLGVVGTLIALAIFGRDPGTENAKDRPSNPPVQTPPGPSLNELLAALEPSPPLEKRNEILAKIRARNNPADAKELAHLITDSEWADPLADSDSKKEAAYSALREIDRAYLIGGLTTAMQSRNARIRAWACDKIADLNESALIPELRAALNDRHGLVRKAAADALRAMAPKDKETAEALERRIADDDWISKLSPSKEGRIDDPNYGGKKAALDALKTIDQKRAQEALKKARESKTSAVRDWAKEELAEMK
ncbi:MAG TPA: serine/threonine-protein kinase [Gemmataceae bacterium]|nr:serine/threonine-protein kinase [Gemmataceae bacterium]